MGPDTSRPRTPTDSRWIRYGIISHNCTATGHQSYNAVTKDTINCSSRPRAKGPAGVGEMS